MYKFLMWILSTCCLFSGCALKKEGKPSVAQLDSGYMIESNHSIKISNLSINDLSNLIISDFLPFHLQVLYKYKDQLKIIIKRNYIFDFDSTFKIIYNTFYEPYFEYLQIPKKYRMKLFAFTAPNSLVIIREWILNDCTEAIPVVIKDLMFCINIQAKLSNTFLSANFQSLNSTIF